MPRIVPPELRAVDPHAEILGLPLWAWCLLLGILLLAVGIWLGLRVAKALRARLARRSRRAGCRGERLALGLLAEAGYGVLDRQVGAEVVTLVDDRPVAGRVYADLLVARDGRRYVAEVKTGAAADPARRETRRQLMEYALAFPGAGLLLVDVPAGRIRRIRFPTLAGTADDSRTGGL